VQNKNYHLLNFSPQDFEITQNRTEATDPNGLQTCQQVYEFMHRNRYTGINL